MFCILKCSVIPGCECISKKVWKTRSKFNHITVILMFVRLMFCSTLFVLIALFLCSCVCRTGPINKMCTVTLELDLSDSVVDPEMCAAFT